LKQQDCLLITRILKVNKSQLESGVDAILPAYEAVADRLDARFAALQATRPEGVVHAIEHGLDAEETVHITRATRRSCRANGIGATLRRPLPLLVVAAETGYAFSGLSEGYWPVLSARLGTDLATEDREGIVAAFCRAHLAVPDDTPYARRYRLIAWPLSNAVAPRQIHGQIALLLREIALRVALDDALALGEAIMAAARRRDSPRLVDWASNRQRSVAVARVLLSRTWNNEVEGSALCPLLSARLRADMLRSPETRAPIMEARKRIVRRQEAAQPVTLALFFTTIGPTLHLVDIRTGRSVPETMSLGFRTLELAISAAKAAARALAVDPEADILFHARGDTADTQAIQWQSGARGRMVDTDTWWRLTPHKPDDVGARRLGDRWLVRLLPSLPDHRDILKAHGLYATALAVAGGAPVGFGNAFILGAPVKVETTDGASTVGTLEIAGTRHDFALPEEGTLIINPKLPGTVTVQVENERLSLVFEAVDAVAPALTIGIEPTAPVPDDLHSGRLLVHLAAEIPLFGLTVRASFAVQGRRTVTSKMHVPILPATLGPDSPLLAPFRNALASMGAAPRQARLSIDAGADRMAVDLVAPDPLVRWEVEGDVWRAFDAAEEDRHPVPTVIVVADHPLALPVPTTEMSVAECARLLMPASLAPECGLIVAPRTLKGGFAVSEPTTLPEPHRRLEYDGAAPGLIGEIEAWLGWSCATPVHVVARSMAAGARAMAETATVRTLCGEEWLRRERGLKSPPKFHDQLAALAIRFDRIGAADLRQDATITQHDTDALYPRVAERFRAIINERGELRAPCDEDLGGALDNAVNAAWEDIAEDRAMRGLEPLDPDTFNAPEDWDAVLELALSEMQRPELRAMIAPRALADASIRTMEAGTGLDDLATDLARSLVDRGRLVGQARAIGEAEMTLALALWLDPARFARADWQYLAPLLLRDRMAARALRLVTLLRRAVSGETM
jgi:hypothetical protein